LISTCLVSTWCLAGCADLLPTTTRPLLSAPVQPSTNRATIVLARPFEKPVGPVVLWPCERYDPALQRTADAPFYEAANYVRIVDEHGAVLADLRYGEHAVIELPAGEHVIAASNWSDVPHMRWRPTQTPPLVPDETSWRRSVSGRVAALHGS